MESPQEQPKNSNGVPQVIPEEDSTLVEMSTPQKTAGHLSTSPDSTASARRITRSQTTGRPIMRWGKFSNDEDYDDDDDDDEEQKASASLKRTFDARAVDDDTDMDGDQDPPYVPSKVLKMEPTLVLSASSSTTVLEEPEQPATELRTPTPRVSPASGEYTFLDATSSSFTSERRGPRIRTAPPVPVPNLTKKSRGRRVPTADDTIVEADSDSKKSRVYICKVEDCGKCFSRGEHLKRHIRSIHTHEKPFKCPHPSCDKRFNRNDNLLQHLRVHKGDNSSQTSVDSNGATTTDQSVPADGSSTSNASQRNNAKTNGTTRRATRPLRKTKSAASTPPIPAARLAAVRASERSLAVPLPRTYSLPPLPSLAPPYHSPAVAGFMNNTNIAVSSLRTAIDESDGEPETEDTDAEARGSHVRALYSFARDLPKDNFHGSAYPGRELDRSELRNDDANAEAGNGRGRVPNEDPSPMKLESASSPYPEASMSRAVTEETRGRTPVVSSSAPSPLPSAVSA
ncbi:hypothetical protein J3A83DRAFT_4243222 [Scleroderma citrinum]